MSRRRHVAPEVSNEEFDAWIAASKRIAATRAAADEEGGPCLSLVRAPDRGAPWPTDLLPPRSDTETLPDLQKLPQPAPVPNASTDANPGAEANAPATKLATGETTSDPVATDAAPATIAPMPFDGVELPESRKRLAGWSVVRQRMFLDVLAETGSVHLAASEARLSARGAYRLRARSPAFAAAWDTAEQLAVGRLSALAFDRAIHGRTEQVWVHGELVEERRLPSDRLLTWLLARLDPRRFAAPWEMRGDPNADPQADARKAFPGQLAALIDIES